MEKVIKILMERDEMSREEAKELIEETYEAIMADPDSAEETMMDMLGLEMDYIFDIM